MKYIKSYENRFTDFFKSKEYDIFDLYKQSEFFQMDGETTLMFCAGDGDIKKFRHYFKDVNPDNIFSEHIPNQVDKYGNTTLIHVATGKGSLRNKKEMIKMLIDNGEDPFIINMDGKTFLDIIIKKTPELKEWLFKTYPDIEIKLTANKYNL